jgi:hypothetical protein
MRHPDLQPNNILVLESHEIAGLIDWQHSSILPLGLAAGVPSHFQNYPDPDSEKLLEPQINLPANYDSLDPFEQCSVRETMRNGLSISYMRLLRSVSTKNITMRYSMAPSSCINGFSRPRALLGKRTRLLCGLR